MTSSAVLLTPPAIRWWCPSCTALDVTSEVRPHTRMHSCSGQGGLTVPMLREGEKGVHRMVERMDYIGDEDGLREVEGRPIMSVVTTRDDGEDCTVYAPCAVRAVAEA